MKIINHNSPSIGKEELLAVKKVIKSRWLISGSEVERFGRRLSKITNKRYSICTTSGTSAIHLALIALGLSEKDEVIVPTYTAADILNAIFYSQAKPVIVDIGKNDVNIDLNLIQNSITKNTKALIIPHTFGIPVDIKSLRKYKIPIIEDCAQSLGTVSNGVPLGRDGDFSIFSFFATKLITTGGQGGAVTTDSKDNYLKMKDLIVYNKRANYIIRYNYPLTDIAASIGNVQLDKLPEFIKRRKKIAEEYREILDKKGMDYSPSRLQSNVNHFRFIVKFNNLKQRLNAQKKLLEKGITAKCPIKQYELLHRLLKLNKRDFQNAEKAGENYLSLPIYPLLKDLEVEKISRALDSIL